MGKYILKRLLLIIPVIIVVVIVIFTIMYLVPGDPAEVILGGNASDADLNALRQELGLDRPYIVRLGEYMYQLFIKFDLGTSYITHASITADIFSRAPRTLLLAVISIIISLACGIPLGVYAATHQNKFGDTASMVLALIGTSLPGFWLALILVLVFSHQLGLLPAFGYTDWKCWILPCIANSVACIAVQARQTRSAMLEVLNSDYIVLAKSKGLKQRTVIYKHALRNALIPVITLSGAMFANSLGGALVIETVFSIPGVGTYLVAAVNNRDYFAIQGGVTILAIAFSIIMLITDIVLAVVDPRIKAQFAGTGKRHRPKAAGKGGVA